MVTGSDDGTARVWDVKTGECLRTLSDKNMGPVYSVSWLSPGAFLATASEDKLIRFWVAETVVRRYDEHQDAVTSVVWDGDDGLVSGSRDKSVKIWDFKMDKSIYTLREHNAGVTSVAVGPRVVSGSADGVIKIWNMHTGKSDQTLTEHKDAVRSLSFSSNGALMASTSLDNKVIIWNTKNWQPIHAYYSVNPKEGFSSSCFAPDGNRLAVGLLVSNTVHVLGARSGVLYKNIEGHSHESSVETVAFSPDGTTLVSGSADNTARAWDI